MELEWLRIDRFRWVQPGTVLNFRPGLNAIIGVNGAGKTTLLELLAAIWSSDLTAYADEPVKLAWRVRSPEGAVEVELEHDVVVQEGVPGAEVVGKSQNIHYTIRCSNLRHYGNVDVIVGILGEQSTVEVRQRDEHGVLVEPPAHIAARLALFRPGLTVVMDPFRAVGSFSWLLQMVFIVLFGEDDADRKGGILLPALGIPRLVPTSGLPQHVGRSLLRYWEGADWADAIFSLSMLMGSQRAPGGKIRDVSAQVLPSALQVAATKGIFGADSLPPLISIDSEVSPWLGELRDALGLKRITLHFSLSMGELRGGARSFTYSLHGLSLLKRDGSVLDRFDRLSHGQRRLFGFLWYLGCSPEVVIADELSNGMHWQMVESVLAAMGDRQAFLAMQDPALLDHMEFESAEDVQRAFVSCSSAFVDGADVWTWRGFTAEEASDLYSSYKKGFRHVNEILRSRGLW